MLEILDTGFNVTFTPGSTEDRVDHALLAEGRNGFRDRSENVGSDTVQPPIAAPNRSAALTVPRSAHTISRRELSLVLVLAEDRGLGKDVSDAFAANGRVVQVYSSSEKFFALYHPDVEACLLVDMQLLDASGLQLLHQLRRSGHPPPAIASIAHNDVQMAVQAMKASALDCIEKPF